MVKIKSLLLLSTLVVGGLSGLSINNRSYDVNFFNENGTLLQTKSVKEGASCTYNGITPTKANDDFYSYAFNGWNVSLENVTSSLNAYPTFISSPLRAASEYDEDAAVWSKPNHLYIHYNRGAKVKYEEYEKRAIWLWPNAPHDLEGTLWGASSEKVLNNFHAMSNHWMTNINGTGKNIDASGAIMDIDLGAKNMLGGKSKKPVDFTGATRLGFLIIEEDSMGGDKHWVSDGGANTYIDEFDTHLAEKGYVHIYCNKGAVGDFTFNFVGEYVTNPTIDDKTGKYASVADVNSSEDNFKNPKTSTTFPGLGVGYQIFVASFRDSDGDGMGDLRGIIDALPYLKDLGVEVLWLTPIQKSESYHGYDITDFYQIDSKFGTLDDYRELIYKAHENGMKILMDFVVNHTSKNNIWFKKSQKAEVALDKEGNKFNYRNMYHWKYKGSEVEYYDKAKGTYNAIPVEKHPDWYRDGESNYYYYGKFGSGMAELNYDCQATRDFVIDMALYWLGFGLDGFRLDAVKHIYMRDESDVAAKDIVIKDTGVKEYYDEEMMKPMSKDFDYSSDLTKNVNFWKEFSTKLKRIYPKCFLVGENFDGWGNRIAPYYNALDSQFDFSLYYHTNELVYMGGYKGDSKTKNLAGSQASETYDVFMRNGSGTLGDTGLTLNYGQRKDFINGAFTSNHDVNRAINRVNLGWTYNSKTQKRETNKNTVITGTEEEINKAKFHAAATILAPGLSWIYYGDELGMSGNTDQHIALYENENNEDLWYRQPFKWGDDAITPAYSFNKYKIEFDAYNKTSLKSEKEQAKLDNDGDMLDFYKDLIKIKKLYGKNAKYSSNINAINNMDDVYSFKVETSNGTFSVYINSGISNKTYKVNVGSTVYALNNATKQGSLPPYGVIVSK